MRAAWRVDVSREFAYELPASAGGGSSCTGPHPSRDRTGTVASARLVFGRGGALPTARAYVSYTQSFCRTRKSTHAGTLPPRVVYSSTMRLSSSYSVCLSFAALTVACAGGSEPLPARIPATDRPTPVEVTETQKPCGDADQVHAHDLNSSVATEAFAPCSTNGPRDYSALVRVETIDQGVHIFIDATDDEVTLLGPDVKDRDVVMVYPKGKGSKGVEVGLVKTKTGYRGDKIVFWDDLGTLTDEGTRIDMAIFDHDQSAKSTEEMHVALAVSTGKSCERAQEENPQTIDMRHNRAVSDLTREQLGAPMRTNSFFAQCGLADSAKADICVAVREGKPLGVSVRVDPQDNRTAACIDRSTRRLSFPVSDSLDVVHQTF